MEIQKLEALDSVLKVITEALAVCPAKVRSKTRIGEVQDARSLFVFFANREGHTDNEISRFLGFKSYQHVKYHVDRVNDYLTHDRPTQAKFATCFRAMEEATGRAE